MPDIIPVEVYKKALELHGVPFGAEIEWKDREGHIWKVSEMSDSHLENAMAFMLVPARAYSIHSNECWRMAGMGDDPIIGPRGDAANDAFDDEFNRLMDMDPVKYIKKLYPPYLAMKAELEKREKRMQKMVKDSRSLVSWVVEASLHHVHDEANPQWINGEGRQVQCSCGYLYFIWDPMPEPEVPSGGPDW